MLCHLILSYVLSCAFCCGIVAAADNGGYHYLGCAKTYAQIGKVFAEALLEMEP